MSVLWPHAGKLDRRFDRPLMGTMRTLSRRAAKFASQRENHERHSVAMVAAVVGISIVSCVIAALVEGRWYGVVGVIAALAMMYGVAALYGSLRQSICDETSAERAATIRIARTRRRQSFIYQSPVDVTQLALPIVAGYMVALYLVVLLTSSSTTLPAPLFDFTLGVLILLLTLTVAWAVSFCGLGMVTLVFRRLITPDPQTAAATHIIAVIRLLDRHSFHETQVRTECAVHLWKTSEALEQLPRAFKMFTKGHPEHARFISAARYVRGLISWVHTPQQHTRDDLRNEMLDLLAVIGSQLYHYLPQAPDEGAVPARRSVWTRTVRTLSGVVVAVLPLLLAVLVLRFIPEADGINPAAILVPAFFLTLVGLGTLRNRDQEKIGAIGELINAALGNAR